MLGWLARARELGADPSTSPASVALALQWDQTQATMKLQMARNAYGLGAPLRTMMERQIVSSDSALPQFSHSQFQLDILNGKDTTLDVEHFFNSAFPCVSPLDGWF